jgi:hypothetical protein
MTTMRRLRAVLLRVSTLVRRAHVDRDIEAEIDSHLLPAR